MSQAAKRIDFDAERATAFAERLLRTLNDGALCLMISIGHRTRLFDAMGRLPPATSAEIAAAAELDERYVREWLGATTTAGVTLVDPTTQRYTLPAEHASSLTRAAAADNMAVFAQYIGSLGGVEDEIVECFAKGGGVPYERFPRFHEVMEEDSGQSVLSALDTHIVPLVPGLEERLTRGIRVLDLGCGRGRIIRHLAQRFPKSRFVGVDLSRDAVAYAARNAAGLGNVEYVAQDLSNFDETAEETVFDIVTTFDAVHDQAQPKKVLRGIYRTLAADGVYLMQDISGTGHVHKDVHHPLGTLLYTVSCMHCMTVSLAQGGEGLGAMSGEEKTLAYLREAGFGSIEKKRLAHDVQNNWYVVRK
jgi:ubiquinone/menaquinone biosynthesis C-methylase UbiE